MRTNMMLCVLGLGCVLAAFLCLAVAYNCVIGSRQPPSDPLAEVRRSEAQISKDYARGRPDSL